MSTDSMPAPTMAAAVPEDSRPPQEALEVDYDPWGGRPPGP